MCKKEEVGVEGREGEREEEEKCTGPIVPCEGMQATINF
jgi:hypothetical protein